MCSRPIPFRSLSGYWGWAILNEERGRRPLLGRNWRGLCLFSFELFSLDLQRLSGHLGFGAVRVLIHDPLKHHARLFLILQLCVRLSDLQRRSCQLGTERVIRDNVVKRLQCLLIPSHAILAFPDPVLCIRRQRGLTVELQEEAESGECRFIVAVLEFFHDPVVQMPRGVLNLRRSGPEARGAARCCHDHGEDCHGYESTGVHRTASVAAGLGHCPRVRNPHATGEVHVASENWQKNEYFGGQTKVRPLPPGSELYVVRSAVRLTSPNGSFQFDCTTSCRES